MISLVAVLFLWLAVDLWRHNRSIAQRAVASVFGLIGLAALYVDWIIYTSGS